MMSVPFLAAARTRQRATSRAARTLRWVFRKSTDVVVCELGLDDRDLAYELTVSDSRTTGQPTVEFFADAITALHKQATLERGLIEQAWSLESFQTDAIDR